jgi:NAD(P)-dependent dehydrogenase (short-subunit alcohol dehydrogenase family)
VSKNNKARKVAVVTGYSKGIGKAIDTEFAKLGYCAVINSRNEDELKQLLMIFKNQQVALATSVCC